MVVYDNGDAGQSAIEELCADGIEGIGDPGAQGRVARLEDGCVVELCGEEGGAGIQAAEGEDGVGVGSEEVDEVVDVLEIGGEGR